MISETRSHMWTSSTLLKYLEFLSVELRLRRKALGLTIADRALIMCDKASVHSSPMFQRQRQNWEREQNAILLHGETGEGPDGLISIPAGWSACGQPNDGFHQHFHALRRVFLKAAVGMGPSPRLRRALDQLNIGIDANARFSFPGMVQVVFLLYTWVHTFCTRVHIQVYIYI